MAAAIVLLLAVTGGALVWRVTADGPWVSPDGVSYLRMAQGLEPLEHPSGHFPFGYPALLALLDDLGPTPLTAARGLGAGLAAVNVLLAAAIVRRMAGAAWSVGVGAALLVATPLAQVHVSVLSEPLFVALLLVWVLLSTRIDESRWFALAAGGVAAAAFLTRFAGVALLVASLCLLIRRRQAAMAWALGAGLPLFAWVAVRLANDEVTSREPVWHPPSADVLREGVAGTASWVRGQPGPTMLGALVLVTAVGLLWRARRLPGGHVLGVAAVAYLGTVLLTITGFDAQTPLDERLLAPAQVLVLLAVPAVSTLPRQAVTAALAIPAVAAIVVTGRRTTAVVDDLDTFLLAAAEGPTATAAAQVEVPLWSNGTSVIWLASGREATPLPRLHDPNTLLDNPTFSEELATLEARLRAGAHLVWFEVFEYRDYLPEEEDLIEVLDLEVVVDADDGRIYRSAVGP